MPKATAARKKSSASKNAERPKAAVVESRPPLVGIVMGSSSDGPTMAAAALVLDELDVPYEMLVVSAHRMPHDMMAYAGEAEGRGVRVIIAGAGGAAHLPGMIAATTTLPVLGVPVQSRALSGLDSLLSIVQMPGGIPVGTLAIGEAGAKNAALLAAQILALSDRDLRGRLDDRRTLQTEAARASAPRLSFDLERPAFEAKT